ncbi:MAG: divalent-cation tolerance protein CutA [Thermodesulfobacteria bacterium]|nr:divalent-cation tolerance protein CutA [Thermodesulfobacteriota bacterium]
MERIYLVYVTASNQEEAEKLAQAAVGERLAACANVYPRIKSYYWWEGKMESDEEAVLILKTRGGLMERLISRLKELHSYSCPCIVALPVEEGHAEYLAWILRETGFKAPSQDR